MSKIKINEKYYKDLSKLDLYGEETKTRETANCYVINKPGDYCFPLVYGNAIVDGEVNKASYTNLGGTYQADFVNADNNQIRSPFIEEDLKRDVSSIEVLISDEENILNDLGINKPKGEKCRFAYFTVLNVPDSGANAVIGIKDSSNNIVWSWHIWLWKKDLTTVTIKNHTGHEYEILPVNLGSKLDDDGEHMKNWFYQWGRKDPMLCPSAYNSNTDHTSYGSTSFSINNGPASNVSIAIKNPCTFYTYGGTDTYHYNWTQSPSDFFNFWDATCNSAGATEKTVVKTVYDPCPPGYSIPNVRVFTGFTSTGSNTTTVEQFNKIGDWTAGWYFKKNSSDTEGEFFPASGSRYYASGGLTNVSGSGICWSAGASSSHYAYALHFYSGNVSPLDNGYRASGFSVRPCKIKTSLPKTESGKHIIHKHSSEPGKTPYPVQLATGEIAVNNSTGGEFLAIRSSNDEIVRFISESRIYELLDKPKDLSKADIHGTIKETRETANSYVISKPGDYCFPLVYGNAIKNGEINTAAYTNNGGSYQAAFVNYLGNQITSPYIETDTGTTAASVEILIADENNVVSNLSLVSSSDPCKFVRFKVTRIPMTGANLVIGVKDGNGVVMWSWHIWLWDAERFSLLPVTITNHEGNNYDILPYNLGTKLDSDLIHMKNWFYQWGRKDPMLCPSAYNSNTDHTSYGSTSFSIDYAQDDVTYSIKNPCTFYKLISDYSTSSEIYRYNWVKLNYYYNFWDATCDSTGATEKTVVKTVYDPCPRGFSVPNARVFTGFTSTGGYTTTVERFNKIGDWADGWYFKKNSSDTEGEFFPASGYRYYASGGLTNVSGYGFYWSAGARSSRSAGDLNFYSGSVHPLDNVYRANGFSVRPFLE